MELSCDSVVLAVGAQAENVLEEVLRGKVQFYSIGDCVKPRNILEAISDGTEIALKI